jgi:hypothetical protein
MKKDNKKQLSKSNTQGSAWLKKAGAPACKCHRGKQQSRKA